jgi:hypothetical protein
VFRAEHLNVPTNHDFLQANAAASKPKGLAASRHAAAAEEGDAEDAGAAKDEAEGEPDADHSSAALASVRTPLA